MTETTLGSKAAPVRFEGVSKVFGKDFVAVDNIDLLADCQNLYLRSGERIGCP